MHTIAVATAAHIIVEMLDICAKETRSYWTDARHDARLLANAKPGTVLLWAAREMGTFVIVLQRDDKPNANAAECWRAMHGAEPSIAWHRIIVGTDSVILETIDADAAGNACDVATRYVLSGGTGCSEIHM